MFRSEEMLFYQLIMPRESAWAIMDQLGYLGKVEIVDHDPSIPIIARPFVNYIRRCDDLLHKLDQITEIAIKLDMMKNYSQQSIKNIEPRNHTHQYLDTLEDIINSKVNSFSEHNRHRDQLLEQAQYIMDQLSILEECRTYLGEEFLSARDTKIDYFIGIVKEEEMLQFQRMVFRVTKGNAYVHLKAQNGKAIYIVMFPDQGTTIRKKLQKVQDSMSIGRFQLPINMKEFEKTINELQSKLTEINQLAELTNVQLRKSIQELLTSTKGLILIDHYRRYLKKEKQLYTQLNKLKMQGHLFLGELWIPKKHSHLLDEVLIQVKQKHQDIPGGQVVLKRATTTPPTYFELNEFTSVFQLIVNTYGVARYREANPALFTIITFPFLFGVMFGDIGHGFCLLLFGLYNLFYRMEPFYEIRYLLVLMGAFSFYCGWIYNDFVSLSLNVFGSCYLVDGQPVIQKKEGCTYPFGLDPAWGENLEFGDSFKMKLSVIIAYCHMLMGICLSGSNFIYKKDSYGFCCKFLPQILFLTSTIGYMDFLIIFKWLKQFSPQDAPSIINTMISMVLELGAVDGPSMWNVNSQELVQLILIIIAVISIPWLWLSHIIKGYKVYKHKVFIDQSRASIEGSQVIELQTQNMIIEDLTQSSSSEKSLLSNHEGSGHHQLSADEEFSELVVHETIETIEFVLGVISNTASYLRLWALSLAHSQLADVFYSLILSGAIEDGSWIGAILRYPLWGLVTFGVLMCMDTMECFLHSLRLHWVEFQNKFYKGDGVEFNIYSL